MSAKNKVRESRPEVLETSAPREAGWRRVLREPFALCLLVPIILRPWLDGITYPTDNFYFLWYLAFLTAVWAVGLFLKGGGLRFGRPMALMSAFLGVALLTGLGTIQVNETYRMVLMWIGYLFLFVLVTNGVHSRQGVGILLGGFVLVCIAESFWSLLHLSYVLPYVRQMVNADPRLLVQYFGTEQLTPELAHRLNTNRAFGTMLFPNALGAFLVLGIPYALAGTLRGGYALWTAIHAQQGPEGNTARLDRSRVLTHTGLALVVALVAAFAAGLLLFALTAAIEAQSELPFLIMLVVFILLDVILQAAFARLTAAETSKTAASIPSRYFIHALLVRGISLLALGAAAFFLFTFFAVFAYEGQNWMAHRFAFTFYVFLLPSLLAAGPFLVTRFWGPRFCGYTIRAIAFPLMFALEVIALWLTYSRGAMLGLALASMVTLALLAWSHVSHARAAKFAANAVSVLVVLVAVVAGLSAGSFSYAQVGLPSSATRPDPAAQPVVAVPEVAGAPATAPSPQPAEAAPAAQGDAQIAIGGRRLGVKDLTNTGSLEQRLSYWRTGWVIAKNHFWTGVGWGNFRTAYPKYQPLDAADVKMAHNDYLQTLCETGIFGLIAFLAFWTYFLVWGARRIVRETDLGERLVLAGLYAGVLAFLLHSVVDFNFYNPSLAFFLSLLTGCFYVYSAQDAPPPPKKLSHQFVALPFLIAAALVSGMALRVYLPEFILGGRQYINVGNDKVRMMKYRLGEFFLKEVGPRKPGDPPCHESVEAIVQLIPLRSQLESFGDIWVAASTPGGRNRRLAPGEPVPPNSFLVVTDPEMARKVALEAIERWIKQIEIADSIFPHHPEIAAHLVAWYDLLCSVTADPEKQREYIGEYVRWAKAGLDRSPEQSWYHEWYGKALWLRANIETGAEKDADLRKGLEEFRLSMLLYPSSSMALAQFADAQQKFGEYLVKTDRQEEGQRFLNRAEINRKRSEEIEAIKQR
ncbi:MAG: O-antigen ligase protein [Candidatus Hydrogenedentes bacterium]|nr:O-antigen ligase protein [Candidatus Hydrogenedentota bacterium]